MNDTARVEVASGEHDTHKVVCGDTQRDVKITRTYSVSTTLQTTVLLKRYRISHRTNAPPPQLRS